VLRFLDVLVGFPEDRGGGGEKAKARKRVERWALEKPGGGTLGQYIIKDFTHTKY